jgi:isochorismate synthase
MDTTVTATPANLVPALTALLDRARRSAAERGWPVLASLAIDLVSAPKSAVPQTGDAFFWEQPSKGICLAGGGEAVSFAAEEDATRFESLQDRIEALFATAVIEPADATPVALAGASFDAEAWRDGTWDGFPDGLVFVPRLLCTTRDGVYTLTLSHLVASDDDITSIAEALADDAKRWLAAETLENDASADGMRRAVNEVHEEWDDSVRDLVGRIGRGEAEKVVLARRVVLQLDRAFDIEAVLDRLRAKFPDCTLFAVRRGEATFVGATPETLVSLTGREVRADCLAGTAQRGADDATDRVLAEALLADDKERREHALVVRGLTEALAPVCASMDVPSQPGLRRTATVQHLHTPFRGTTDRRRHVLELVARLHPTPATAGLPRATSMALIRQHEGFDRGWYAGPVGWLDANGDGEFCVALRSALVRDETALLYAGCGIVAGSDPEREFVEAGAKLQAMRGALLPPREGTLAAGSSDETGRRSVSR